jgi:hypothetical protein
MKETFMSHPRIVMMPAIVALSQPSLAPTGTSAGAVLARVNHPGAANFLTIGNSGTSGPRPAPIKPFIASAFAVQNPIFSVDSFCRRGRRLGTSAQSEAAKVKVTFVSPQGTGIA